MAGKVTRTAEERFWGKVRITEGCWEWVAAGTTRGYGMFRFGDRNVMAHRAAYEMFVGPIPNGMVIDHLCRNHCCVNPAHLEAVPQRINVIRGEGPSTIRAMRAAITHCRKAGHPLSGENLYTDKRGRRACRECQRVGDRLRKRAKRAAMRSAA